MDKSFKKIQLNLKINLWAQQQVYNWISATLVLFRLPLPRLRCQTETPYVQTVPDKTCLCPDRLRLNVPMSRLSCVQIYLCVVRAFKTPYVQTCVRSISYMIRLYCVPNQNSCAQNLNICANICAFMSRLSCVQKHLWPVFRAFKNICVFFVRSKLPMTRLPCVQNLIWSDFSAFQTKIPALKIWTFVGSCPDYRAFKNTYVHTFVRSKVLMSRLSCVYVQTNSL